MSQLIPTIQIIIIFQCLLFIAFLVFGKRLHLQANQALCVLLTVMGSHMALNLVRQWLAGPALGGLGIALGYLYGPVLYAYAVSLVYKDHQLRLRHAVHILPAFAVFAASMLSDIHVFVFAAGIFISLAAYGLSVLSLQRRYRAILEHTRSAFDSITLQWLSHLLQLQLVLLLVNIIGVSFYAAGYPVAGYWAEVALFLALLFLVNFIIFNALQRPELFAGVNEDEIELTATPITMPQDEASEILQQTDAFMLASKPYLNPDLTLKSLGRQMQTTPRLISQAINVAADQNFSEYINRYRITRAQSLLREPESRSLSVLDVMLEAGFNTKSNFNRSFKAVTGMTPLAYKKQATDT